MANKEWQDLNKEKLRAYRRKWYASNKSKQIGQQAERRKENKEWLKSLKLKCSICEESHIATLDFHHNNPEEKEFTIPKGVHNGLSRNKVLEEVEKCTILCSNCHRKHHYKENTGV